MEEYFSLQIWSFHQLWNLVFRLQKKQNKKKEKKSGIEKIKETTKKPESMIFHKTVDDSEFNNPKIKILKDSPDWLYSSKTIRDLNCPFEKSKFWQVPIFIIGCFKNTWLATFSKVDETLVDKTL